MTTDLAVLDEAVRRVIPRDVGELIYATHNRRECVSCIMYFGIVRQEYRRLLAERDKPQGPMTSAGMPTWRTGGP